MLLSYRGRLRRDLQGWRERGLIDAAQHDRIAAEALAPPGLGYLQGVLVLCVVVLAAPAFVAFVAANWAGMAPALRMAVLVSADVAAIVGAWLSGSRSARLGTPGARAIADGAATLSLALAAATLALVGQTFHVPPNLSGFAATVAVLGLATALVARSGGAAFCACVALAVADVAPGDWSTKVASPVFWPVGLGLFAGFLSGWLPARTANLLILLVVLANHLGPAVPGLPAFAPDRLLTVGMLALGLGHALRMVRHAPTRIYAGGEALAQAAAGMCLLGILAVAARTLGWGGRVAGPWTVPVLGAIVATAALLLLPWRRGRVALPLADLFVLGAAASASLILVGVGAPPRDASAFWTVWGGILPALGLVVAGHLDDRRALFGWGLAAVAGLIVGMLAASRDLLGFSANLLGSAALVALTLALCRWADKRSAGTAPDGRPA